MRLHIRADLDRTVLLDTEHWSVRSSNDGMLHHFWQRHPTVTDQEHDSLILKSVDVASLRFAAASGECVWFSGYLVKVEDWGDFDPTTDDPEECDECTGGEDDPHHKIVCHYAPIHAVEIEPQPVTVSFYCTASDNAGAACGEIGERAAGTEDES